MNPSIELPKFRFQVHTLQTCGTRCRTLHTCRGGLVTGAFLPMRTRLATRLDGLLRLGLLLIVGNEDWPDVRALCVQDRLLPPALGGEIGGAPPARRLPADIAPHAHRNSTELEHRLGEAAHDEDCAQHDDDRACDHVLPLMAKGALAGGAAHELSGRKLDRERKRDRTPQAREPDHCLLVELDLVTARSAEIGERRHRED
mmetsp:Transcript_43409/g.114071  ORF Transcript_43409/g.114071 Transcript_43409/m.114071 type:complete len:201 (+) Transcript_43409:93-695(+)